MGKAQSKRSVDITTETKKGTEDEITEKMEKIEDLDKKEVNGDATISEKSDQEKKDIEEVENDKDMTTEKDVDVQASGNATESQNGAETLKDELVSATPEEISPLADESIKKSKKEKVKKKWSFRSISFGKKDKQKPAKNEDAGEDGSAATNGAEVDEKIVTESEDTQKDKSSNENEEKTTENHENGNATPQELNGGEEQIEEKIKTSDEKSNVITANVTNNTTTTEKYEPVQNETAAASSELSEKTESTSITNETKKSENVNFDDASKNGNGIDEKIIVTEQEQQKTGVTNTTVEAALEKTSAVTIESSASTNGEVIDQIHQNGDHGESEQEVVEKSKAQIEVNFNTDNKVSAATTIDSISSTSINPSNVQIHVQDLNTSSEKPDEVFQIDSNESVEKPTDIEIKESPTTDQFPLSESAIELEVENKLQIEIVSDIPSETINSEKSPEEKLGVDLSPPPLPISPPPSQVSVFLFTNNESVEDSIQTKTYNPPINNLYEEEIKEILPTLKKIHPNSEETETINIDQASENRAEEYNEKSVDLQCKDNKEVAEEKTVCKNNRVVPSNLFEEPQIEEDTSVAVAAAVIDEITETAAEIVNKQLKCNEEEITDEQSLHSNEERREEGEVLKEIKIVECKEYKAQISEDHVNDEELVRDVDNSSKNSPLVFEQTNNITTECSLYLTAPVSIQDQDEMLSLKMSENLLEEHLDPTKEFVNAKDIKDSVTVAGITQDLSVTCE